LQQLHPVLDDGVSGEQLSGMLALKRAELAERVADDQARLARVEQRLRYIELEDDMSLDFVIKEIPPVRVAQIRYAGEEGLDFFSVADFVIEAGPALHDGLRAVDVDPEGPTLLHYDEPRTARSRRSSRCRSARNPSPRPRRSRKPTFRRSMRS
jgi:hypothetical protein